MSVYDTREIGKVKIVMLKGQDGADAANVLTMAGSGKMTSYLGNVVDTDIILGRAPKAGDRLYIYLDTEAVNPVSIKIYGENNSDAYTLTFMMPPEIMKGRCLVKITEFGGLIPVLDYMDDMTLEEGMGIEISGNTITNTMPQLGDDIKGYDITTAVNDGDLGMFSANYDIFVIDFKAAAVPNASGKYTCVLSAGPSAKFATLKTIDNTFFGDSISAGTSLICKKTSSGSGTTQDPVILTVSNVYHTNEPKIDANGNLTASGHVLDTLGNDLALLGELGLSVDSEGYIIQTLEEEN